MTKLTDMKIQELISEYRGDNPIIDVWGLARSIEAEAYRAGELAMRERAAKEFNGVLSIEVIDTDEVKMRIRNLPIEGVE